jgi:CRISPR/Cas system-associated protein Csm6
MRNAEYIIDKLKGDASSMENATDWFREHLNGIYDIDDIMSNDEAIELVKRVINQYLRKVGEIISEIENVKKTLETTG